MTEGGTVDQTLDAAVPTVELLATDRCDRCGAQAYVRVNLASGGELMFCAEMPVLLTLSRWLRLNSAQLGFLVRSA